MSITNTLFDVLLNFDQDIISRECGCLRHADVVPPLALH